MKGTTIKQIYMSYNTEFHARCYETFLNGAGALNLTSKPMKATMKKIRRRMSPATRMVIRMYWRDHSARMQRQSGGE